MRTTVRVSSIAAILVLAAACAVGVAAADDHSSAERGQLIVVFKDGHRQTLDLGEIARIDFKAPAEIVFKDGAQKYFRRRGYAR